MANSIFNIYRGPQDQINAHEIQDGHIYFSTDTKQIMLDCNYVDPREENVYGRFKFGGSAGIHYASKELSEEESEFGKCIFTLTDFTNRNVELPGLDDLILNTKDNSFYRVVACNEALGTVEADRLTVAGSGGGGSGGAAINQVKYNYLFKSVLYGTKETTDLPIQFTCASSNEGAEVEVELYIDNNYITTFSSEQISITDVNTINLGPYLHHCKINTPTTFHLVFNDIQYHISTKGLTRNILIYNMYLSYPSTNLIKPTAGNYDFVCFPWGGVLSGQLSSYSLEDRGVYWELREVGESSVRKRGHVFTQADRGSASVTCTIEYPGPGEYVLTAWLQGRMPNSADIVRSEPINIEIPFFDEQGDPLITTTAGVTTVTQYDKLELQYMVAYNQSDKSLLRLYANYVDDKGVYHQDPGTVVEVTNSTKDRQVVNVWPISFDNSGTYYLSIVYLNNDREETQYRKDLDPIVVQEFADKPEINETDNNLKLYLTAKGRQNAEENKTSWTSQNVLTPPFKTDDGTSSYTMENTSTKKYFENFNWQTNGWISDALHLTNGAKLTVPFSPFTYNPLEEKGLTIELDFKISNVRDANQPAITCISTYPYDSNTSTDTDGDTIIGEDGTQIESGSGIISPGVKIQSGIVVYHNKAQLFSSESKPAKDSMSGRTTVFYPGERIRLTYVITDKNFSPSYMVYTYLNGVISGLNRCIKNDTFKQVISGGDATSGYKEAEFIFDSTYMDIDIYNIRVYSAAQKHDLILHNDIADSNTPQQAIDRQIDNSILGSFFTYDDPDTTDKNESYEIVKIDLDQVTSKQNIPYMVFYDGRATGGKKDENWYGYDPDTQSDQIELIRQQLINQGVPEKEIDIYPKTNLSRLPTGKKDYRHMQMYYVDPTRGKIKDEKGNDIWKHQIGTPENPVIVTAYAQGTSSLEYPIKNIRFQFKPFETFNDHFEKPDTQIETYQLEDRVAPVDLFTLKADYMESSSSHNTGTANLLDALYAAANIISPAARAYPDYRMLTAILGHPIVCFFKPYKPNADYPDFYQYIGRYNFNLDKATHEVFGFEPTMHGGVNKNMIYGYLTEENENNEIVLKDGFNACTEFNKNDIYYFEPNRELIVSDDDKNKVSIWENLTESEQKAQNFKVIKFNEEKNWKKFIDLQPLYLYRSNTEGVSCVQCWECLNNPSNLVGMREQWVEEIDKIITYKPDPKNPSQEIIDHGAYATWTGAFESRYPEYETEASSDKRALSRMINWVNSTDRNPAVVKEYLTKQLGSEPTEEQINDERENRLHKFTTELKDYFNLEYLAFYYVITEALMMIDSRGKNMMLACYDADPEAGTGHWCPIFYDMDTMLGLDNSGNLKFDYSREDNEPDTFNLATTYEETQYSVLWTNYREGCQDAIKEMYLRLRKKPGTPFSAANFRKAYNDNQADAWNETYINEDIDFKFISPLVNNYEVYIRKSDGEIVTKEWAEAHEGEAERKTAANYLYAAQGTRSQHRDYWLTNRFIYLDSKYGYNVNIGTSQSQINCRVNSTAVNNDKVNWFNFDFDIKSLVNQYITIALVNTTDDSGQSSGRAGIIGPEPVYSDRITKVITNFTSGEDQEVYIYDMDNITSLGDLSNKGFKKFKLTRPTKFTDLIFGHVSTPDKPFYNADLGATESSFDLGEDGVNAPLLKVLNIENCRGIKDGLSLTEMPYLQEVYAKGSNISSIIFADGGNIQHLELPKTVDSLIFTNQLYYNTFINKDDLFLENPRSIKKMYIKNSPNIDTKTLFKDTLYVPAGSEVEKSSIDIVYMDSINWTITSDELIVDNNNRIKEIPILDKLISIPFGASLTNNNVIDQIIMRPENNTYLAGTIHILNEGTGIGVDELVLYEKYTKLFPGLTFEYADEGNNILAYSININNNVQEVIYNKKMSNDEVQNYTKEELEAWFTPKPLTYISTVHPITEKITYKPNTFDQSTLPDLIRKDTGHYVYELRGWSLTPHTDFQIDDPVYNESREARDEAIEKVLAIKITHTLKDDGKIWEYKAQTVNDFNFTVDQFDNQIINFYPVYAADLNSHIVYFYDREEVGTLLKMEEVQYGKSATPPIAPQWIELPKDDVTVAYLYPFMGYNLDYTNITSELKTYATYGKEKKLLSSLTGAEIQKDCFEIDTVSDLIGDAYLSGKTAIKLRVKANYKGEAIVVPKEWTDSNGYTHKVGQISVYDPLNPYCTSLKRIFFEKDNEIINLGQILESDSTKPLCQNFEYLDFSALKNLQYIFNQAFSQSQQLKITALPDSLLHIGANAFAQAQLCEITKLPTSLRKIDQSAFYACQNMRTLDINAAKNLEYIGEGAFYNCDNLIIKDETIIMRDLTSIDRETIKQENLGFIGENAFFSCDKLVLNFNTVQQSNIRSIGQNAFKNCYSIGLKNLPQKVEEIGAHSFMMDLPNQCSISFNSLPASIVRMGSGAFQNCMTIEDTWYVNTLNPVNNGTKIFAETTFYDIANLQTIVVPWAEEETKVLTGYDKGWSTGTVTVRYKGST